MVRKQLRAAEVAFRNRLASESFSEAAKRVGGQILAVMGAMQIGPRAHPKLVEKLNEDLAEFERLICE